MEVSWREFESEWTNAIVDSINFVREQLGLTIKELAGRLQAVGWQVSTATLAGILSGRKRASLSVAELMAFARALDVPPSFLLLCLPFLSEMPANPSLWGRESVTPASVAAWLRAWSGPPLVDGDDQPVHERAIGAVMLVMYYSVGRRDVTDEAALVIAASQLSPDEQRLLAEHYVLGRARLVTAVKELLGLYSDADKLKEFAPPLPAPPPPLRGVQPADVEAVVNRMSLDDLHALTSDDHITKARALWEARLKEIKRNAASTQSHRNLREHFDEGS